MGSKFSGASMVDYAIPDACTVSCLIPDACPVACRHPVAYLVGCRVPDAIRAGDAIQSHFQTNLFYMECVTRFYN